MQLEITLGQTTTPNIFNFDMVPSLNKGKLSNMYIFGLLVFLKHQEWKEIPTTLVDLF